MKFIKITTLTLTSLLIIGCGNVNNETNSTELSDRVAPIIKNSISLTDDTQYVNEEYLNEKGQIDITDILIEKGYLDAGKKERFAFSFLKDGNGSNLTNMKVSYWIDTNSKMFNLRMTDTEGKIDTLYIRESIENILKHTNSPIKMKRFQSPFMWMLRLISFGIRACSYTNCLDNSDGLLNLNNLYINYNNKKRKEIYRGTVADFYAKSNLYTKLLLVLDGGVKETKKLLTATGAIRLKEENIENQLMAYLKKTTENIWISEETEIRVEAIELDGNDELLVLNVVERADEKLYDIKLNVVGDMAHHFDGTLFSVAPELHAKLNINGTTIDMLSGETGFTSSDVFKNVPLKEGDKIEVVIYDDDAFYWDKLHTFNFAFDGKKVIDESKLLTTTLEFLEEGKEVANNAPKYDVTVTIEGDPNENHDEGGTLPDFTGSIMVDGKAYSIAKKNNSLVNRQVIKDVPINLGDKISVTIVEDNVLWSLVTIMKHSFEFDANDEIEENKRVKVTVEFLEL